MPLLMIWNRRFILDRLIVIVFALKHMVQNVYMYMYMYINHYIFKWISLILMCFSFFIFSNSLTILLIAIYIFTYLFYSSHYFGRRAESASQLVTASSPTHISSTVPFFAGPTWATAPKRWSHYPHANTLIIKLAFVDASATSDPLFCVNPYHYVRVSNVPMLQAVEVPRLLWRQGADILED